MSHWLEGLLIASFGTEILELRRSMHSFSSKGLWIVIHLFYHSFHNLNPTISVTMRCTLVFVLFAQSESLRIEWNESWSSHRKCIKLVIDWNSTYLDISMPSFFGRIILLVRGEVSVWIPIDSGLSFSLSIN